MPSESPRFKVARAKNDLLYGEDGSCLIDLFSANGTTWLGHCNPRVANAVSEQLSLAWNTGAVATEIRDRAYRMVDALLPASHRLVGLYSTGMEASEFAIRFARRVTGRNGVLGFEGSMHGKSLATAYLGWDNGDGVCIPDFVRLPFIPAASEEQVLDRVERALETGRIGALFIEPIQGTAGGYRASGGFIREVAKLCRRLGALLVFDECLTGLYRTGTLFHFEQVGVVPDLILMGKALGNGFPVSGVIADRRWPLELSMLPGSTYAGNPLASAAVVGSLGALADRDAGGMACAIERSVRQACADFGEQGCRYSLRGAGALWVIDCGSAQAAREAAMEIFRQGVFLGFAGRFLRLLPAATIESDHLERACSVVAGVLAQRPEAGRGTSAA